MALGSVECLVQGLSLQVAEPRSVLNELSTLSGTMDNGTMEGAQWTWITILAEVVCILTSIPIQQAPCPGWADLAAGSPWCQPRLSSWSVMVTDGWGLLRLRDWGGRGTSACQDSWEPQRGVSVWGPPNSGAPSHSSRPSPPTAGVHEVVPALGAHRRWP